MRATAAYLIPWCVKISFEILSAGFQGFRLKGVAILQPTKQPKGGELSDVDTVIHRLIAGLRIRVEHAIDGVKRDRIVKDTLRTCRASAFGNFLPRAAPLNAEYKTKMLRK